MSQWRRRKEAGNQGAVAENQVPDGRLHRRHRGTREGATRLLTQIDKRSAISVEWTKAIDAQLGSPALAKLDNRVEIEKLLLQADIKVNALRTMVWRLGATGDTSLIGSIAKTQTALRKISTSCGARPTTGNCWS